MGWGRSGIGGGEEVGWNVGRVGTGGVSGMRRTWGRDRVRVAVNVLVGGSGRIGTALQSAEIGCQDMRGREKRGFPQDYIRESRHPCSRTVNMDDVGQPGDFVKVDMFYDQLGGKGGPCDESVG